MPGEHARSINLANAVSIAAYECYRQLARCSPGGVWIAPGGRETPREISDSGLPHPPNGDLMCASAVGDRPRIAMGTGDSPWKSCQNAERNRVKTPNKNRPECIGALKPYTFQQPNMV